MKFAAKIFDACGFPGPAIVPYQYQVIGLSEALLRESRASPERLDELVNTPELIERVRKWLWVTTYSGVFTGMNGSQIRRAIDHLSTIIANTDTPILPDLVGYSVQRLDVFRKATARSTALVLLMAQQIGNEQLRERVWARLGENGHDAVECIFPKISSTHPGNRVVTIPEQLHALRESLHDPRGQPNPDLLRDHFIPPDAWASAHDPAEFCDRRANHLASLEAGFVTTLGLSFET